MGYLECFQVWDMIEDWTACYYYALLFATEINN